MRRDIEIAIIGAGLGGMTVAGLLQRAGFAVTVYEQADAFSRIGAGIHLSSNVTKIMRRLGIEDRLVEIGLHPDAFVSRKWDTGEVLFELPFDPASEAHYGGPYVNVHRGDLHAVLESALDHGTIAFGHRLAALESDGAGVRLTFENGHTAEADIAIGADGVRSRVREAVARTGGPRFSGHVAHRAVFPAARLEGLPIRACTKWWGPDRHILVYYMTQAREEVYVVSSVPAPEWPEGASVLPGDRDAFIADFDGFHPELRQVVAAAPDVTLWPVFDRDPLPHWSKGPLILLGDACHPLLPYMASGAAMAIEDAAVLARCFAEIDGEVADVTAWYEANRMPRVGKVREISLANTWLRGPTDPDWLFQYDACTVPLVAPQPAGGAADTVHQT
ncbi:FAD-dependent monooxygenase [Acuticoccus kandeliae]|uniref:FAD-dependent monooxygenase n=1 Tax=Acuticoccus kandeliae TaxID=2073160 RepID=UPI000D3EDFA8|nr:FAD-dependent monooxygenase [Acuticoccus kandeliae]